MTNSGQPKYKRILEELRQNIGSGHHKPGERLPGETELGSRYGVSRLTIQRVFRELQDLGLIERRAGSGTYVLEQPQRDEHLFGLLIPGLGETEIFEPICQGMARAGRACNHALLWRDSTHHEVEGQKNQAMQLCADYVQRRVSGVFFAPLEGFPEKDAVNSAIVEFLHQAKIPVVLLDRCVGEYPFRSAFDLVGIDNRRAGCLVTRHLLQKGAKSLLFLARPFVAPTVDARIEGFFDALGRKAYERVLRCDPGCRATLANALDTFKPDGIVCANDITAAAVMQGLEELGRRVPEEIRIVGIDDVKYAKLLPVPLTTLRQPCQEMGETAIQVMLSRIAHPTWPARDILLSTELIVRQSCGS